MADLPVLRPSPVLNLVELLSWRSREEPDAVTYRFLPPRSDEPEGITNRELDLRARALAARFRDLLGDEVRGERALLLYPAGLEFIAAFFGCLYCGIVPVPLPPPDPDRPRTLSRLEPVARDAAPLLALTCRSMLGGLEALCARAPDLAGFPWVATDDGERPAGEAEPEEALPGDLAYLQYTSGSTSSPKGVMVSHANVLHNERLIAHGMSYDRDSRAVMWVPNFHDDGIVHGILQPLYTGCETVLLAPVEMVRSPLRWLRTIDRFRATHSGGPNFAYALAVRKTTPEERAGLDLSCWRTAYNGAEPIRPRTLEEFVAAFAPCGFRPGTLLPVYGLAEATLLVSSEDPGEPARVLAADPAELEYRGRVAEMADPEAPRRRVVSCGRVVPETEVAVVEPETRVRLEEGRVGEIWVSGESVASGYWNLPEVTEETLRARIAGEAGRTYLRTGDLGFLYDRRVYVTSRLKDLVIVRGRNVFPPDVEATLEVSHPGIRAGCSAVVGLEIGGEERLVAIAEVKGPASAADLARAVCEAVLQEHDLQLYGLVLVEARTIPKTSSGKIQRPASRRLLLDGELAEVDRWSLGPLGTAGEGGASPEPPAAAPGRPPEAGPVAPDRGEVERWLRGRLARESGLDPESIGPDASPATLGLDSAAAVELAGGLSELLGRPVDPTVFWDHSTLGSLAARVAGEPPAPAAAPVPDPAPPSPPPSLPLAVVGIACRFPGGEGVEEYWRALREGVDSVTEVPPERWRWADHYSEDVGRPGKTNGRRGGFLSGVDLFDAGFFGLPPREAMHMDPQQRLLLEAGWHALEDAGIVPGCLAGSDTGVFVGLATDDYRRLLLEDADGIDAYVAPGSSTSIAANRLSYLLDLRGPSLVVDTACSSSLVALHLACQSLRAGECSVALAGAANLLLTPASMVEMAKLGFLSPGERCRPYGAGADGYVRSEGVAMVVLKPLERAVTDRDDVYAVVLGSAVNQDGRSNGLTAPNREAQEAVLRQAYRRAGVPPSSVQYVEGHGSGTALGDSIETRALGAVVGEGRDSDAPCLIGSAKSNFGHAEAAAGMAGLVKTVLALRQGEIPPSLHSREPNPHIDFRSLGLRVQAELGPWPAGEGPRRAGVSAFGFGGTNAHVVLEEAPRPRPREGTSDPRPWQLLCLSARTSRALDDATARLARHLDEHPELELADVSHTLRTGRSVFEHRRVALCRDRDDAIRVLRGRRPEPFLHHVQGSGRREPVFLLPGLGEHHADMGRGLFEGEPVFRRWLSRCAELLEPELGRDLRELLYAGEPAGSVDAPPAGDGPSLDLRALLKRRSADGDGGAVSGPEWLGRTEVAQPAVFAVEYALARLLMNWGIRPRALLGHSLGEYVAACLAGVLTLEDALLLVARRARLIQELPPGAMLAVPLSGLEVEAFLDDGLSLAAENGPALTVVSGDAGAVAGLEERLTEEGIQASRLRTAHAFHSARMEAVADRMVELVRGLDLSEPRIPYLSNVTGTWITAEEARDPTYWARHLCGTVRFADAVGTLLEDGGESAYVEVGPGATLTSFLKQHPGCSDDAAKFALPALRHGVDRQADDAYLLRTLGTLWLGGVAIDWQAFDAGSAVRRVHLPPAPFERRRFWKDGGASGPSQAEVPARQRSGGRRADGGGFYGPTWKRTPVLAAGAGRRGDGAWLVLAPEGAGRDPWSAAVLSALEGRGRRLVVARPGGELRRVGDDAYELPPGSAADFEALLGRLGEPPTRVLHLWSLGETAGGAGVERFRSEQELGFSSLVALLQALGRRGWPARLEIVVAARAVHRVTGTEALRPEQATLAGLCRVVPQEHSGVSCRLVDAGDPPAADWRREAHLRALVGELSADGGEPVVALRAGERWIQGYERIAFPETVAPETALRERGVYLVTGGLGAVGMALARYLGGACRARLALVGRTPLPPRARWDQWLRKHGPDNRVSLKISGVRSAEATGAEVLVATADVADAGRLAEVVAATAERFGRLDGVVHAAGWTEEEALVSLDRLDAPTVRRHFEAKAEGAYALASALEGRELDFVLLQSSISAVLGGLSLAAYAAANSFLDAFAQDVDGRGHTPWKSVDWDGWGVPGSTGHGLRNPAYDMTPEEAFAAFERALTLRGMSYVVCSVADLEPRLGGWVRGHDPRPPAAEAPEAASGHARPRLTSEYVEPRTPLERTIAALWQEMLRIDGIGARDNFFELGGQSLLGAQFFSRLHQEARVPGNLSLRHLLDAPTPATLAETIESLAGAAAPVGQAAGAAAGELREAARDPDPPLSYNQEQLWIQAQLSPGDSRYNEAVGLQLRGELDLPCLRRAFREIVRRHEVLRTSFTLRHGRPVQRIGRPAPPGPGLVDLRSIPAARRDAAAAELARRTVARPFDLERGPLLRTVLLRLGRAEHRLVLVFHHTIHDGESLRAFATELSDLYTAFTAGRFSPLPGVPLQYADFALWQRRRWSGEAGADRVEYWRERLAGSGPTVDLPLDRPRPPRPGRLGGRVSVALNRDEVASLQELAAATGTTLFMVLLTGFFTLLHRYADQDRLRVGVPRSGRGRPELGGVLGCIVDTQVLALELDGRFTFRKLLARLRERVLEAEEHEVPLELLAERLTADRGGSLNPFFQVMFGFQVDPRPALRLPPLEVEVEDLPNGGAKCDLDMALAHGDTGIEGRLEYAAELFDEATVEGMVKRLRRLLAAAGEAPDTGLWDLPLLDEAERLEVLGWSGSPVDGARPECLHRLFEDRVDRDPERVALSLEGGDVSYGELDERANRLARELLDRGAGPGDAVMLLLEEPLLQVTAMLGTLKAGAAFVCPDRRSPADRLGRIAAEARPVAVVTESRLEARVPEGAARPLLLDRLAAGGPAGRPGVEVAPGSPCYVAYTSGSTGAPKGIVQTHASFCQFLRWQSARFEIGPSARFAQWAAWSYDAAYCEILGTLCFGATLCVPRASVQADARALVRWLRESEVTLLQVVPSFFRQVLEVLEEEPEGGGLPRLERVLLSGEVLPSELVSRWTARFGALPALFNLYGPSETVLATCHAVLRADASNAVSVPVGRPLAGRQVLVLDRAGGLCPPGVPGEVYVRSDHLTLGYLHRPGETARAFVADPLPGADGGHPAYRTGDRGRWRGDGCLLFCGRTDGQVKLRGMRLELGEIEAGLTSHPSVRACAVVLHRFEGVGDRLVAYVVGEGGGAAPERLRGFLAERVPEPMIPTSWVSVEELPTTVTGKLDRSSLPEPSLDRSGLGSAPVAPRDGLEERIAGVFRELLETGTVGVHDDFFALGGSSLTAVRVAHRISSACGVELPPATLWDAPTVAGLARWVEAQRDERGRDEERLRRLVERVQGMSDEEARRALIAERSGSGGGLEEPGAAGEDRPSYSG